MKDRGRLVRVVWLDAYSSGSGWQSIEDVKKQAPVGVVSVGYVLREEPTFITLASSITDDGDCDGDVTIPTAWMVEPVKELT